MSDVVDDVVRLLARIADHRATIAAGWIAPVPIVTLAPEPLVLDCLVALFGVVLVLHEAQLRWGPV